MAESNYTRARKAKAHVHEANRLGWPETKEGIKGLVQEMTADERTVCLCGRFIKRWDGWRFQFPPTMAVIGAIENRDAQEKTAEELVFSEDEEG